MLTLGDSTRFGRRDFLRIGSLGLGGLALPALFPAAARGGTPLSAAGRPVTDRSVIFVFLHGGPSQFETFDPKPTAPAEIRSATGEIPTALPGVTFGSSFPKLAKLADRVAVVRSFVPGDAGHNIKPVVSKDSFDANLILASECLGGQVGFAGHVGQRIPNEDAAAHGSNRQSSSCGQAVPVPSFPGRGACRSDRGSHDMRIQIP